MKKETFYFWHLKFKGKDYFTGGQFSAAHEIIGLTEFYSTPRSALKDKKHFNNIWKKAKLMGLVRIK